MSCGDGVVEGAYVSTVFASNVTSQSPSNSADESSAATWPGMTRGVEEEDVDWTVIGVGDFERVEFDEGYKVDERNPVHLSKGRPFLTRDADR